MKSVSLPVYISIALTFSVPYGGGVCLFSWRNGMGLGHSISRQSENAYSRAPDGEGREIHMWACHRGESCLW